MARSLGTMKLSSNFEPRLGAPLDGRMVVPTYADLTTSGNFPYPYIGMLVSVQATKKLYMYNGGTITNTSSWDEVGGSTISGTVGNSSTPIWLNNGTFTAVGAKFLSANQTGEVAFAGGEDLNDYTTPGVWGTTGGSTGSTVAASILNKPTFNGGFRLYVESCGGDMTYVRQTILCKNGRTFIRTYLSGTWGTWLEIYGKKESETFTSGHLLSVDPTYGLLKDSGYAASDFVPISGGTLTGTLTAKGGVYTDARDQGALNMNNSNIYGVNAIYMADASDNAGEGINWINSTTTLDTLWASGGVLLFTPNRADGTATTAANSQKVGRFTVNPTSGQVVITDGTYGGIKSSGYTIAKSVPSDAKFTDTTYTNGTGLTLSSNTFSISQANVSTILNLLSSGDSDATAADYLIAQYAGGGTTTTSYHRRPVSKVVNGTVVKAALGTVSTTANKYLRDDGTWQAITATKLGTATVGSGTKPFYLSSGTPTAFSSTVGNKWNGIYMDSGSLTACEAGGSKNNSMSLSHHQGVQVLHITGTYLPSWGYATCKAHVFLADGIACEVIVTLHNYSISAAFPTYKVEYMHARATSNALGVCYNYKTTGTQYWTLDVFVSANSAQASGSTTVYPHVTLLGVYGFGGDPVLNIGNFSDTQALSTATGSATKIS